MANESLGHATSIAESGWRRWLRRIGVDLRRGEGAPAILLFTSLFLVVAFQISTKTIRQSVFVHELGADRLPWVYLIVALVAYPALRIYARFTGRLSVDRLLAFTSLWAGTGLLGFWFVWNTGWAWLAMAFYVGSSIIYALLLSQFWMLATRILDARQARRLFAFVGAGGLLGAMCGGQIARLTSGHFGTRAVLPVAALLLGTLVLLIAAVRRHWNQDILAPMAAPASGSDNAARWGFAALRRSKLLTAIATVLVLATIVGQIVDLQFNWAVEQSTAGLDARTASFGNFFTTLGAIAFVFQILMSGRILKSGGVGFALKVLPVFLAVGTLPLVASALISPEMLLLAAFGLKLGESGLRYSLDLSARELLFLPIPTAERRQAKTFIDVVCQRGAKGIAAILLLPVAFQLMEPPQAGWISLGLIGFWLAAVLVTRKEYVRSFRAGLELRAVEDVMDIDLQDARTLDVVLDSLGSPSSRSVLHSLEILHRNDRGQLVPLLLLSHDDPVVRCRTLEIMADIGREDAAHLAEQRLGDESPHVRAEAIRALASLKGEGVRELMLPRLHEPDAAVRAAAVVYLLEHGDESEAARAAGVLNDLLAEADPTTRIEGAKVLGGLSDPICIEELLRMVRDPNVVVSRAAIDSVRRRVDRDGFNPLYVPTLISRLGDRRIRHDAHAALLAFGRAAVPALAHFLCDPAESEEVREALPGVLARIASPEAAAELLAALEAESRAAVPSGRRRRRLIEAMLLAGRLIEGHRYEPARIFPEVVGEARAYGVDLSRLHALEGPGPPDFSGPLPIWSDGAEGSDLLHRLLAERLDTRLWCLMSLLSLTSETDDFRIAYHGLKLLSGRGRARAYELLTHALPSEVRADVLAILDDTPIEQRIEQISRRFGIARLTRVGALRSILRSGASGGPDGPFAAAALYAIHTSREPGFDADVEKLAGSALDGLVRETAGWVRNQHL